MAYFNLKGSTKKVKLAKDWKPTPENIRQVLDACQSFHWHLGQPQRGRAIAYNSMFHRPDGTLKVANGGELLFELNCDPDLFADRPGTLVHARFMMDRFRELHESDLFDAIHFDTVGRWGKYLNYRREHWAYADFPLTFDNEGRVCQYAKLAIYEMMRDLRAWGKATGMRFELAGMKPYSMETVETWIPSFRYQDGRFFSASLAGSAWHEGVYKLPDFMIERTYLGRKPYRVSAGNIVKHGHIPSREEIRRSLATANAWGIVPEISPVYFRSPGEHGYDERYSLCSRDKDLWQKYGPAVNAIRHAGWRARTLAVVDDPHAVCERFGAAEPCYFTLFASAGNDLVTLTVEADSIGIAPGQVQASEMISGLAIDVARQGGEVEKFPPVDFSARVD